MVNSLPFHFLEEPSSQPIVHVSEGAVGLHLQILQHGHGDRFDQVQADFTGRLCTRTQQADFTGRLCTRTQQADFTGCLCTRTKQPALICIRNVTLHKVANFKFRSVSLLLSVYKHIMHQHTTEMSHCTRSWALTVNLSRSCYLRISTPQPAPTCNRNVTLHKVQCFNFQSVLLLLFLYKHATFSTNMQQKCHIAQGSEPPISILSLFRLFCTSTKLPALA